MGCLLIAVAALLSLVMPAAIARSSLGGAFVLIALLAVLAYVGVAWRVRRRSDRRPSTGAVIRIGLLAVVYAAVVTGVHFVG